jgi:hypothetical protein
MEARVVVFVPRTTPNPRSYGTEPNAFNVYVYYSALAVCS